MARKIQPVRESVRTNERRRPSSLKRRTGTSGPYRLPFQRPQYIAFGASLLAILIGFLVLSFESITLAPLLMVAGYCVGIPLALLWKKEHKETAEEPAANDTTLQTELTGG